MDSPWQIIFYPLTPKRRRRKSFFCPGGPWQTVTATEEAAERQRRCLNLNQSIMMMFEVHASSTLIEALSLGSQRSFVRE